MAENDISHSGARFLMRTFFIIFLLSYFSTVHAQLAVDTNDTAPQIESEEYLIFLQSLSKDELIQEALRSNQLASEGGGWTGTGGNFHLHESNIWFMGNSQIPYCVARSEDYPLSQYQVEKLVTDSIRDWINFFRTYGMYNKAINIETTDFAVRFTDGVSRSINFNFKKVSCSLDEKGEVKAIENGVVFLFGVKHSTIAKNQMSEETQLGVALRKAYDHKSYMSTGFIWLQDFTTESNKIKHLLLHEIGHILGMKHDSVFVMDEDVAYQLRDDQKFSQEYFGSIESAAWMYRLRTGMTYNLTATRGRKLPTKCFNDQYMPNKFLPKYVKKIFNLQDRGCHKLILSYVMDSSDQTKKMFKLQMMNLKGNVSREFRGRLNASLIKPKENPSPGVYTEWLIRKKGQTNFTKEWFRMILDEHALMDLPVRGNLKTYPLLRNNPNAALGVKITNRKGILMEVFVPRVNEWWVIKNVHNRFEN